jgi:tetratricopeptide (TPR) repeat protein
MSAEELFDRAVDHVAEGDLAAAVEAYRAALEIDSDYADALEGLSIALADLERWDEAIAAALRVVEITPDEQLAYTNVSRIYQRAGDVAKAEEWAAKARILDWKAQLKAGATNPFAPGQGAGTSGDSGKKE